MLIKWTDSTTNSCYFFGPLDTATINMATSAGWPFETNNVPNQVVTNPNINATNQSVANTSTYHGVSGHPIHHEWVWFSLEGWSGCSLGPAQMECQSIALVIHQELGVMPLQIQQLNYHDVLIEFDSEFDVEWVIQKLLRMEWWMGAQCKLECVLCSDKEGLWQFREGEWVAPREDPEWIDLSRRGPLALTGLQGGPFWKTVGPSVPRCNPEWA